MQRTIKHFIYFLLNSKCQFILFVGTLDVARVLNYSHIAQGLKVDCFGSVIGVVRRKLKRHSLIPIK
jgi:hypothetical protein